MNMASTDDESSWKSRQAAEVDLLQAMYPDQISWHEQRQELTYISGFGGSINLRLDDGYPERGQPTLIRASDTKKQDRRDETNTAIRALGLSEDEEMLDAIIQSFEDLLSKQVTEDLKPNNILTCDTATENCKTTIIWLHHLLNTNKRKLATNPTSRPADIVGITKPGYPGVLVYSGKAGAVDEHVAELKVQRWQAFQIRLEETTEAPWTFTHECGIKEVEGMADVASAISNEACRGNFLKAMNIK